ncbi:hypothetical protein ACVIGB_000966 [Bradyrhizobium sp. USDA 4341]
MRRPTLPGAALAACLALFASAASAACPAALSQGTDTPFYLGIAPSDGPLEVFCRIQQFPGKYTLNVRFTTTDVHRSIELNFPGEGRELAPEVFRNFVQSLIPAGKAKAVDPDGMAFSRVLENVAQGAATEAPINKVVLSIPPNNQAGVALAMWEPIQIRVKPMYLDGVPFTMTVNMEPNGMRLMSETLYGVPGLIVGAWRERLNLGNHFIRSCTPAIPICQKLPDVVPIHFAYQVESVVMVAEGDDLSQHAERIMKLLAANMNGRGQRTGDDPNNFDLVRGVAKMTIQDLPFEVAVDASSSKVKTTRLAIRWRQVQGQGLSWQERTAQQFLALRDQLNRNASAMR